MSIELNKSGYERAITIIKDELEVEHDSNNWDEVAPTEDEVIRYLNAHSLAEYGSWFLGVDTDADANDKSKFVYPFGDFSVLHKSALLRIQKDAEQHHHSEIAAAVKRLLEMIEYGS